MDYETEKLKLERTRLELEKIKELVKLNESKQTINNTTINADKVIINYLSIGNENLEPLTIDLLKRIANNPKEAFTNFGIKALYFNPSFPENQIIKPKPNINSKKVTFYDGNKWSKLPIDTVSENILNGLSKSVDRKFRELSNVKELDRPYDQVCNFISDNIDDSKVITDLITEVNKNIPVNN